MIESDVVAMFIRAAVHLGHLEHLEHLDAALNNAGAFMPAARIDKTSLADFQAGLTST